MGCNSTLFDQKPSSLLYNFKSTASEQNVTLFINIAEIYPFKFWKALKFEESFYLYIISLVITTFECSDNVLLEQITVSYLKRDKRYVM